ncbi:MAG: ribonuclease III domain-containing protein [Cyanobacteriota bacterium]|nr:ribonuclease III domain-containing protein [Cyanobacteriota bacterium]
MPSAPPDPCPGPAQLAWLGDAVWELHQRQHLVRQMASPRRLHDAGVARVRAEAQSLALERLEPLLREEEREWVRRGRNAAGRRPRHLNPAIYGRASGFETMVGWLHLHDPERLSELLSCLDPAVAADRPDSPL